MEKNPWAFTRAKRPLLTGSSSKIACMSALPPYCDRGRDPRPVKPPYHLAQIHRQSNPLCCPL
ncbi:hypothetical protein M406DRAFT_54600 [Cryphonectria parasitica EP155]|uniref:Uncharacterized protein n=1 Tax=Cryphonectria parasitica (strain ATCC 38755 / EP155) TaxID=660469 RepID=A0A9P4Y2J8_CRYP1|nr:uncharacterized protein M406DRAFT_54600 [Cryphonectria parasitica EP155]KAF3765804.1 hypothetical protein M406DRAFT_54600 [Cryphonectria parasitica EP155]